MSDLGALGYIKFAAKPASFYLTHAVGCSFVFFHSSNTCLTVEGFKTSQVGQET